MQLIGFDPKFTGVAWCCPEHILYAQLFTMKCFGPHRATSEISLLPAARCFAAATPPRVGRNSVPVAGLSGFFAFLERPSDVMVGGWLFCFLVVFLIVLVFERVCRFVEVDAKTWKVCKVQMPFLWILLKVCMKTFFFPPKIVADSDF